MGLSGRKVKQRIPQDPRNLSWADDAARFGSNYLSKFGWDASKGLGAGGDGRTSHIKVSHKLDMLGIGAGHQKDPNGIAWKQNTDFENMLRRLNENLALEQAASAAASDSKTEDKRAKKEAEDVDEPEKKKEKKKKRKHKGDDGDEGPEEKKKRKKEKKEQVSEAMNVDQTETTLVLRVDAVVEEKVEVKRPVVPRHRSHRARAIAAKNMSSKSAAHISEILGVAPTDSTSQYTLKDEHQGKLTSLTEDADTSGLEVEKITTSTKSVADYFKEKLQARAGVKKEDSSATPSSSNSSAEDNDAYDMPRMGLGSSRLRTEIHAEVKIEEETQRMGLSKFSSLMSSSFLASTSFIPPTFVKIEDAEGVAHLSEVESEPKKKEKKDGKKKKEKVKEEEVEQGSDEEDEKKKDKKKSKKDKKGKGKASDSDMDERKPEKKEKSKKDKKSKSDKVSVIDATETEKAVADSSSIKKEKRKKEKKKHRTCDEDS